MAVKTLEIGQTIRVGGFTVPGGGKQFEYGPAIPPANIEGKPGGFPLSFDPAIAQLYSINRIHLALTMFLGEEETEKQEETKTNQREWKTEAERNENQFGGAEGLPWETQLVRAPGFTTPYEKVKENFTGDAFPTSKRLENTYKVITERSVLPIAVNLVFRLQGPDGILWSQAFDVDMHNTGINTPGLYLGVGTLDSYADLFNPLILRSNEQFTLRIFGTLPSIAKANWQLGSNGTELAPGTISFFYDTEERYPGMGVTA